MTHQDIIFKGVYYLCPLSIPLCLAILAQNTVIVKNYWEKRHKLVPSLFIGLAVCDMLAAQGVLIISVISVFVYAGHVPMIVFFIGVCSILQQLQCRPDILAPRYLI